MKANEFDYEELRNLAEKNKEEFEKVRAEMVEDFISSAPEESRDRLRQLQCQVDLTREASKNPLDSLVRVYSLMWSKCAELSVRMEDLIICVDPKYKREVDPDMIWPPLKQTNPARILPIQQLKK